MWSARASALFEAALSGRESRSLLTFVGALSALALAQSAYGVAAGSLGLIADAAEAAGAPEDYVRDLRSRPCQSVA